METIKAYFKTQSAAALCARRLHLADAEPEMVAPFQSRTWMIEIPAPEGRSAFTEVLETVNAFDGMIDSTQPSPGRPQRPGGAPFMNNLPQSVVDRFEDNSK